MAGDVSTGIRLEASGVDDYKKSLKEAANAGETLENSLKSLSESEGNTGDRAKVVEGAIKLLRQESKTLSAELKAVESGFDGTTSAEDQAAAKKDVLNRQIETQRGLLRLLNEQLNATIESEGENSLAADKQREAIYKAQTALNKMESELRETEKSLDEFNAAEDETSQKSESVNRALQSLQQESKTLSAEMKALESSFDSSTSAEDQATAKKDVLNRQIENQRKQLSLLEDQLSLVTESEGENSEAANKQREAIFKAKTELNKMERELKETEEGLDDTTDATEELTEATEESSGKVDTYGDVLKANLASEAIVKGLEKTWELIEKIGTAAFKAAQGAAAYADTYLTMSTTTGLSTDQLQEFAYMSELVDVSLDTLTGSMSKLITKMKSAQGGNKTTTEAFQALGVAVTDADGNLRDSREVFFEIIDALGQIEDPTERDAAAMELFGKKAQDLNPLIAQGSSGIQAFAEEAHKMGYVLDEETLNKLGALDDSFQRLNNTKTLIGNLFGAGFATPLEEINTELVKLAQNIDWEQLGESAGGVLENLTEKAVGFVESLDFEDINNKISGFFQYIEENGDKIATTLEAIGGAFATWKGIELVKGLVGELKDLYGWAKTAVAFLGTGAGVATAGIGLGALGAYEVADRWNELKTAGTIGDGHELREYAENVAYLEEKIADLEAVRKDVNQNMYWDFMQEDQYQTTLRALENAREEMAAFEAAQGSAPAAAAAGTGDPAAQAAEVTAQMAAAKTSAESLRATGDMLESEATGMLQSFESNSGEIVSDFVEGTDEMSSAVVSALENTNSIVDQNMAILNANAYIWGSDMIINLANGIIDSTNSVLIPAIDTVAAAIDERVGFSEPDEGPLSKFHTFAPDMMQLFAQGIRDGRGLIADAIGQSFDLGPMIAAQGAGGRSVSYGGVNVTIYGAEGQSVDELYDVFSYRLARDVADREAVFST